MKLWTKLLVAVIALALVGVAEAAGAKGPAKGAGKGGKHAVAVRGKIVSVGSDGSLIVAHAARKGGDSVTIPTDASTNIEVDGVAGKTVKDLHAGETIVVTPATGTAKEIKVVAGAKEKKKSADPQAAKQAKKKAKKKRKTK